MSRFLPPSKVMGAGERGGHPARARGSPFSPHAPFVADVERSILGDGCVVEEGARIVHSVIGLRSRIREVGVVGGGGWVGGQEARAVLMGVPGANACCDTRARPPAPPHTPGLRD